MVVGLVSQKFALGSLRPPPQGARSLASSILKSANVFGTETSSAARRVPTKFEKDERLRRIFPLPWVAITSYCVATWVKSSYSAVHLEFGHLLEECLDYEVTNDNKFADALMDLAEMVSETAAPFSPPVVRREHHGPLVAALLKAFRTADPLVLELGAAGAGGGRRPPALAARLARTVDVAGHLRRLLHFALPLPMADVEAGE
ncbi:unnamed protein product [Heterosigma akashiwo]